MNISNIYKSIDKCILRELELCSLETSPSHGYCTERRRKHHLALMYMISRINLYIDDERPEIILRNRNKIKFKTPITKLTKVLKSPFYRGARLWDMLTEDLQRATTKVKFKQII